MAARGGSLTGAGTNTAGDTAGTDNASGTARRTTACLAIILAKATIKP